MKRYLGPYFLQTFFFKSSTKPADFTSIPKLYCSLTRAGMAIKAFKKLLCSRSLLGKRITNINGLKGRIQRNKQCSFTFQSIKNNYMWRQGTWFCNSNVTAPMGLLCRSRNKVKEQVTLMYVLRTFHECICLHYVNLSIVPQMWFFPYSMPCLAFGQVEDIISI